MLLKRDKMASDLLELLVDDLVASLKQKIRENLNVTDMELPLETERKIRDIIKI